MTTQITVPEVDIELIDVVEGFNSRQDLDQAELEQMAVTIKAEGVVQPIKVRPKDDGRFDLVYGHKRLAAAKLAGLEKIPVTPSTGNPRVEAFYENNQRSDLNPIERALDLKAIAEELGLTTQKAIAAKAGKKSDWVGEHLRLLKLPEEVQRYIAAGDVPITAEPKLRKIAAVSPEVAAWICEVGRRNEISGVAFVERFGDILEAAGGSVKDEAPTMIRVRGFDLSEAVTDTAKRKELVGRINATLPDYRQGDDPTIQFGDAEVDAARANGCLVEYQSERNHYSTSHAYITDAAFVADLIERFVERREKEIEEAAAAAAESKEKEKVEQRKAREERKASGEKSPQAKAKERKAIARRFNESLKRALLKKRTVARRKKFALSRAQAVAVQLISDNPELAARGLRLVSDQLQDLETTPLKKGGNREKVLYADKSQSTTELLRKALGTKDPLEVIEVLAEALLAGIVADNEEVPSADHVGWSTPVAKEIEKLLATEIKEVRPRRQRKPY